MNQLDRMRPTWAEVDLGAIGANVAELKRLSRARHFMAVVKANGYGHGAVSVAKAALETGADWLGVALVEEGVELRRNGITAPILVLGYVAPGLADTVLMYDLRVACFDLDLARALNQWARPMMRKAKVHVKVDTGMGRVGVQPHESLPFIRQLAELPHIEVEGIFTHFAAADEPQQEFTARQVERFDALLAALEEAGITPAIRHAANSAGLMLHPDGHYDLVRAGIALYGLPPAPGVDWPARLTPALSWKSRIAMVKWVEPGTPISYGCTYRSAGREQIASLPVGYADGLFRLLSNRGSVLIQGRRCPIVGRVCMDQTLVRVPDELTARVGDEVVLIGRQGKEEISATEMARTVGTINYEIVCAISQRVPRFHLHGRPDGR
ncbi:MAG: alanine racemase [Bacillota bacterium]